MNRACSASRLALARARPLGGGGLDPSALPVRLVWHAVGDMRRPSALSGGVGLPGCAFGEHGFEADDQFACAGGQGELGWLFALDQTVVEIRDNALCVGGGGKRRQIEGAPNIGTPASDMAVSLHLSAIVIEGRNTDEGCNLSTRRPPQFRQQGG